MENLRNIVFALCTMLGISYPAYYALHQKQNPQESRQPMHETSQQSTNVKHIIFDLDGVLLTTNRFTAFKHIGITNIMSYILKHRTKPSHETIFQTLGSLPPLYNLHNQVSYHQGHPMPDLMVAWQMGLLDNQTLLTTAQKSIIANPNLDPITKKVSNKICEIMFHADVFLKTRKKITAGVHMLSSLANAVEKHNKNAQPQDHIQFYILSNWDKESCQMLLQDKRFKNIFTYIPKENCYFSGNHGFVKPGPEIFQDFFKTYAITDPYSCILIDDEYANVLAAQREGMQALHCNNNYKELLHTLLETI